MRQATLMRSSTGCVHSVEGQGLCHESRRCGAQGRQVVSPESEREKIAKLKETGRGRRMAPMHKRRGRSRASIEHLQAKAALLSPFPSSPASRQRRAATARRYRPCACACAVDFRCLSLSSRVSRHVKIARKSEIVTPRTRRHTARSTVRYGPHAEPFLNKSRG